MTLPTAACLSLTRGVSTPARSQPPSLRKCCTPTYSPAFPGANFSRHAAIPQHPNHIQVRVQIYLDKYGTFVVTSLLIVSRQPRRSVPISTTPLPHYPSTLLSCNSFPHNLLSDPHPLNPVASIFYKNIRGRGVLSNFPISSFKPLTPAFATDPQTAPITPFFATHPKSPSSKPFVCHTSETPRGWWVLWLTRNLTRIPVQRRPQQRPTTDLSRPHREGSDPVRKYLLLEGMLHSCSAFQACPLLAYSGAPGHLRP